MELIETLIKRAREKTMNADCEIIREPGSEIANRKLELLMPYCPADKREIAVHFTPRPRYLGPRPWIRLIEESKE